MPLVFKKNIDTNTKLGIWKITENENFLKSFTNISTLFNSIKSEQLRLQKLAVRAILREFGLPTAIDYHKSGKPYIKDNYIGISHSKNFAAIITSKNQNVSIDIETSKEKAWRLKNRFLNPEEERKINTPQEACLVWSTKECYIKLHNNKQIILKELITSNILNNSIEIFSTEYSIEKYQYINTAAYTLVWAIESKS